MSEGSDMHTQPGENLKSHMQTYICVHLALLQLSEGRAVCCEQAPSAVKTLTAERSENWFPGLRDPMNRKNSGRE
jgi:hypothetical protein